MPSPGTKRIVLRVKNPEFHKHSRPRVKEPYAQPMPLENVTLEYKDHIKLEGASQNFTASKLEEPEHEASQAITPKLEESSEYSVVLEDSDCDTSPQSATVAPLPCTVLTWDNGNPQAEEGTPSRPWKYYIRSFDPSVLPIEIMRRREAMERYEDRLERGGKRRRLA
ncbi:hypothetical protein M404DRAFT_998055 [Pisolithus tinctorius Marx 270]|uniref:Uncharacterized protein n=1 Tax=Pisolithus tinctorius Marx 270 TaxID=870435 RepID=A0A0C3JDX2_PISTI|nr:hypothetical protein M404DRAFT_998055 [Pisolithus tinctorius Marx 270]